LHRQIFDVGFAKLNRKVSRGGCGKPLPYVEANVTAAVFIVRAEPTAEASLAAMRARSKFGMAIAAMIKMIATTINSSISEKPF
jgi:hypothetical protein